MLVIVPKSVLIDLPCCCGNSFAELYQVCSGFSLTKLLSLMKNWLESICVLRSGQQQPQGRFDCVISLLIYSRLRREGMSDSATSWSAWSPDWWL